MSPIPRSEAIGADEAAAGDSVTEIFRQSTFRISSILGQLLYLSRLYCAGTGRYQHPLFDGTQERDVSHEIIAAVHREVFGSWLNLGLDEQLRDVEEFVDDAVTRNEGALLRALWASGALFNLPPAGALPVQRQLFETEMKRVVELTLKEGCNAQQD